MVCNSISVVLSITVLAALCATSCSGPVRRAAETRAAEPDVAPDWEPVDENTDTETLYATAEGMEAYFATLDSDDPARYDVQLDRARVLTLLAEAEYEQESEQYVNCLIEATDPGEDVCDEPTIVTDLPEFLYREVLAKYDGGPRVAEICYYLGHLTGDSAIAQTHYERVISEHYDSAFRSPACAALGDLYFDQGLFDEAHETYQCAVESPDVQHSTYGRYRQAWIAINREDPTSAIISFQFTVVQLAHATGDLAELRETCLDDMLFAFADLEDGWDRAEGYYTSTEGAEAALLRLERLIEIKEERGDWDGAIAGLTRLRDAHPEHAHCVAWGRRSLHAYYASENPETISAGEDELSSYFAPTGAWGTDRAGDPGALSRAALLVAEIRATQHFRTLEERRQRRRDRRRRR